MAAAEVPTAMAQVCQTADQVAAALDAFGPPYVVKDDALAAGKGVVVTDDRQAAIDHAASCDRVVIEEFLDGTEVSLFAITEGNGGESKAPRDVEPRSRGPAGGRGVP
jgi:phosphoribosylamine--glycine ligase